MTLDEDLSNIDHQLSAYVSQLNQTDEKEATLNAQISSLRLELLRLKDSRFALKQTIRKAQIEKESLARKLELEKEAAIIEQSIAERRAEAELIIANAHWKDA